MTSPQMPDMFKQIQKMQADMQAAQDALANTLVEGSAGGGVVKATVTGDGELRRVTIDPSVVDPSDIETLEDLVVAAVSEAMRQAKHMQSERLGAATGGLDLDSLMGGLGGLLEP
jgi:DNA-binding YbaB/EbfC family protein